MPCPDCKSTNINHFSWCKIHLEEYGNFTDWTAVHNEQMRIIRLFKTKGRDKK